MACSGYSDGGAVCAAPTNPGRVVSMLLEHIQPATEHDRRSMDRIPIPYLFELSPAQDEVSDDLMQAIVVVGKDICERGIGFFHDRPIPFRRGTLTAHLPEEGVVQLKVDLLWCRCTSLGWYESGGRLRGAEADVFTHARAG